MAERFTRDQVQAGEGERVAGPVMLTINWQAGEKFGGRTTV